MKFEIPIVKKYSFRENNNTNETFKNKIFKNLSKIFETNVIKCNSGFKYSNLSYLKIMANLLRLARIFII